MQNPTEQNLRWQLEQAKKALEDIREQSQYSISGTALTVDAIARRALELIK
jgi:hypothetical protein